VKVSVGVEGSVLVGRGVKLGVGEKGTKGVGVTVGVRVGEGMGVSVPGCARVAVVSRMVAVGVEVGVASPGPGRRSWRIPMQ
jgi:hypothetical protein